MRGGSCSGTSSVAAICGIGGVVRPVLGGATTGKGGSGFAEVPMPGGGGNGGFDLITTPGGGGGGGGGGGAAETPGGGGIEPAAGGAPGTFGLNLNFPGSAAGAGGALS